MRAIVLCLISTRTAHAGEFVPPKGCTAYLTVQSSNCSIDHHWTCSADAPGERWRAEVSQDGQVTYIGKIDNEAQWMVNHFVGDQGPETLITPATDPANLTELLSSGIDTYDFTMNTPDGVQRVVGFDRIAQRDVVIDNERLHRTDYSIQITNAQGDVTFAAKGSEFVSETHRRFFSGLGDVSVPTPPYSYKDTPVEFIYPGEKGYLDNTPKYGCDVLSAQFSSERTLP